MWTTIAQVKDAIYLSTDFTDSMVAQAISSAEVIVVNQIQPIETNEDILALVELYLAAHFCSVREPQIIKEDIGGRDSTFKEERRPAMSGYGLASTAFGQQAIAIDTTNVLSKMAKKDKKVASISTYGVYDHTEDGEWT